MLRDVDYPNAESDADTSDVIMMIVLMLMLIVMLLMAWFESWA